MENFTNVLIAPPIFKRSKHKIDPPVGWHRHGSIFPTALQATNLRNQFAGHRTNQLMRILLAEQKLSLRCWPAPLFTLIDKELASLENGPVK
ncbi:hypothetical protein TYRP_018383 [Tyrophagus putrescentiae]|nr:hypothetical protein TYRP_018383 [Tyrophagus putrescentiae]